MDERPTNTTVLHQDNIGTVYVRLYADINDAIRDPNNTQRSAKLLDIRYHLFTDFVAAPTLLDAYIVLQHCRRQYSALMTRSAYPEEIANVERGVSVGAD